MATGSNVRTFFEGSWYSEDKYVMRAADHGSWLGTSVLDGAISVSYTHLTLPTICRE